MSNDELNADSVELMLELAHHFDGVGYPRVAVKCRTLSNAIEDAIQGITDTRLDICMKLIRDNKMQWSRELTQADLDVIREARNWGK